MFADRRELAAILAGGALGALARTAASQAFPASPNRWPWAIFAINLAGAFVLGYFVTRLQERMPITTYRRPLIGTGFCGALTTFSTFQLELLKMVQHDHYGLAAAYASASVLLGYLAIATATLLARQVRVLA